MIQFNRSISLAMTGASGAQYGLRLLELLLAEQCQVLLMISKAARIVINTETDLELPEAYEEQWQYLCAHFECDKRQLVCLDKEDWFASVASGSSAPTSMVICPASGGTLSAIAQGASNNLIERAADVALKERRQLIVVPRETPLSTIHLENMLKLSQLGALVLPASPGFYHEPKGINDLVDFVVARILDQLKISQGIMPRWGDS